MSVVVVECIVLYAIATSACSIRTKALLPDCLVPATHHMFVMFACFLGRYHAAADLLAETSESSRQFRRGSPRR